MKQNEIPDKSVSKLKAASLANIFNIYYDKDLKYTYNLLNKIYIPEELSRNLYTAIFPLPNEYLPQLSYRVYKTIDLAWLIAITNDIDNMLEPLAPAVPIRILRSEVVKNILTTIQN